MNSLLHRCSRKQERDECQLQLLMLMEAPFLLLQLSNYRKEAMWCLKLPTLFSLKRLGARVGNSQGRVYRIDRPIVVDPVFKAQGPSISDWIAYLISPIGGYLATYSNNEAFPFQDSAAISSDTVSSKANVVTPVPFLNSRATTYLSNLERWTFQGLHPNIKVCHSYQLFTLDQMVSVVKEEFFSCHEREKNQRLRANGMSFYPSWLLDWNENPTLCLCEQGSKQ